MKRTFFNLTATLGFSWLGASLVFADDLPALSGKWTAEKTDDQGRSYQQILEFNGSKFVFKIMRGQDIGLYAKGDVKTEHLGPFNTAKFFNIQGGRSDSDLQPVEDDRTVIYRLGENELTTATDFDKERSQAPSVTTYTKAKADEPKTLFIDKIVMHKTPQSEVWYLCFEATVGSTTQRFNIPDKGYEKDELTIATDLAIPDVRKDQICKFVMKLDDVSGDECTEEMDDRSAGSFTVTESGSQTYKPEDQWRYTLYWHLK
jgi:hypothetical protein